MSHKKKGTAYTSFEWSRLASNNVDPYPQLALSGCNAEIFALELPVPQFDQIKVTIYSWDTLKILATSFGEPELRIVKKKSEWVFPIGIVLTRNRYCYTARFQYDRELFSRIFTVLRKIPQRPNGKPSVLLQSTETAWDVKLYDKEYEEAESILRYLAERTIPKNIYAAFYAWIGDFKDTSDDAINGKITFYFVNTKKISEDAYEKLRANKDRLIATGQKTKDIQNYIMNSRSSWRGKIYLKHYDGMWHIRFEITLSKNALRLRMNKGMDSNTLAHDYLQRVQLADFFEFGEFQWKDLVADARRIADRGKNRYRLKNKMGYRTWMRLGYGQVASTQYRLARSIAKAIGSEYLKQRISGKEFARPVYPFEA